MPLSSILDVDAFSVRVDTKDLFDIPKILKAVPKERIKEMQTNLAKVWRRCVPAPAAGWAAWT